MKIEIAKDDLCAALKVASLTVGSGSDLSSHYLFRALPDDGPSFEVLSYDMRVFSRAPLGGASGDVLPESRNAFTVEAWRLDKWVSSVGDGVLTLASDGNGSVVAKGPRSKIKLRSLDPSKFPYWDGLLGNAQEVGAVDPDLLSRALNLSQYFVSTDDTSRPEICQTEATEGVLQATNRRAVSSIKVRALPALNLRISGKDLPAVLRFLGDKNTQGSEVVVQEASRSEGAGSCSIFLRPDGSYIGVSRPTATMPKLDVEPEETPSNIVLNVDEFSGAIDVLLASAPKGHQAVTFQAQDGALVLSMPSEAGGDDMYPLVQSTETELGDTSFSFDYGYVRSIADLFDLDSVTFGVHPRKRGGYVSFSHEDAEENDGNQYYTVIVWRT